MVTAFDSPDACFLSADTCIIIHPPCRKRGFHFSVELNDDEDNQQKTKLFSELVEDGKATAIQPA